MIKNVIVYVMYMYMYSNDFEREKIILGGVSSFCRPRAPTIDTNPSDPKSQISDYQAKVLFHYEPETQQSIHRYHPCL